MGEEPISGISYGLMYRYRKYNLENKNSVIYKDYCVIFGYRFNIWKRIILDSSYGMGLRESLSTNTQGIEEKDIDAIFPIQIKISYIF